jgi:chromosome segregation ATPase
MADRHRTLVSLRRRDRAEALAHLNHLLEERDKIDGAISETNAAIQELENAFERPLAQTQLTGQSLTFELNHRQRLNQTLQKTTDRAVHLLVKREAIEREIRHARERVAKAQIALKAINNHR